MKFLTKYVNMNVLEQTYFLYVRPHLDYCDVIFHNQKTGLMNLLESVQYQAALIVSGCWKGSNKAKLIDLLGWQTLSQRKKIADLLFFTR